MRAFAAIPIALALLCATPALAAPRNHAAAAKRAARRGEWRKALREWKAAYAKDAEPALQAMRRDHPPAAAVAPPPARVEAREAPKKETAPAVASNEAPALPAKIAVAANPVADRQAPVAAFSAAPLAAQPRTE